MGLSIWQLKRQLAFLAAAVAWAESPSAPVLAGGAVISEDLEGAFAPGSFLLDGPLPATLTFARVSCTGHEYESDLGRIRSARLLLFFTAGGGWPFPIATGTSAPLVDTHGINMEIAALRNAVQPQGKSDGRSVDELISRFTEVSTASEKPGAFVDDRHGFQGRLSRSDAMQTVNGVQVLKRAARIDVLNATVSNYYHRPRHMQAVGPTTAHISWLNAPARFDTFKNELWRGVNAGDAAPTSRAGVQIALSSNLATSATDAPGPGRWGYSIFTTYTETPTAVVAATADRASFATSVYVTL